MLPKIMILAAGRGKRLRPLTDQLPKPLVKVGEHSLIEHHLLKLPQQHIVINHAWLGEQIVQSLGDGNTYEVNIEYSPEPEGGLETAGGIINALPKLTDGKTPFMVVNGDVFCDYPLSQLLKKTLPEGILAHLVLVKNPSFKEQGDFGLEGEVVSNQPQYTFSGISLLHPDLFNGIEVDFLPLAPILRRAIEQGSVTGELYQGSWDDIGTLERLEQARKAYEAQNS